MHFCDQGTQTPHFNQIIQQGCQSTRLKLRLSKYLYFVKVAQQTSGDPPQDSPTPPGIPPPDPPIINSFINTNR